MKIAIIGGSSFIGQILLNHLSNKKYDIISTYNRNSSIKSKFRKIKWKKFSLEDKKKNYYKYFNNPDIVINLSWPDIPNYKTNKHFKTFLNQKKFSYNLIENGLKNLIVIGTCYEYGKKSGKLSENIKTNPVVPYAISKLKLLKSLQLKKKNDNFNFTWLRPFFVYGNNEKRKTLFTLIRSSNKESLSKVKVCGSLVRDFIPVSFLCKVILKIIKLNNNFGILNVCTGKGISVKEFVKLNIKNKNNLKLINMNGKNPNNFEPKKFWGDNKKLRKILKWKL